MSAQPLLDDEFLRRLETLTLVSRRIFRGRMKGERRSKKRGYSSEFADYRNYVEGDDLRFIDWNIYGRLDRLFLKLFLEEEDLNVHLLIDTSLSMGFGDPRKIDHARRVAAAIGYIGLQNMDRVQIHAFADGLGRSSDALRGKRSAQSLFSFLEALAPDGETRLEETCSLFARRSRAGKGVVVLLSDLLDENGYEEPLKLLLGANLDVYVLHLLAPEEVEPSLEGDLRLVDVEDGHIQEITMSRPLLQQYRETVRLFCGSIKTWCIRRGAAYCFSSTAVPFDTLVLQYLRQAGLLR